ncbi:flagellar hook-length control protein FliK [Thiohalorhabdus methylotrophus]|uniref:Flagellar hook-length control protein FliK n=1 Tax=Thiohalorhabdus methylotrophus TaxID=3242694 RepID=A0ABV4TVZ3_9GAMM
MNDLPFPLQRPSGADLAPPGRSSGAPARGEQGGFDRALDEASRSAPERRDPPAPDRSASSSSSSDEGSTSDKSARNQSGQRSSGGGGADDGQAGAEEGGSSGEGQSRDGKQESKQAEGGKEAAAAVADAQQEAKQKAKGGSSAEDLAAMLAAGKEQKGEKASQSGEQSGQAALLAKANGDAESRLRQVIQEQLGLNGRGDGKAQQAAGQGGPTLRQDAKAAGKGEGDSKAQDARTKDGQGNALFQTGSNGSASGTGAQTPEHAKGATRMALEGNSAQLAKAGANGAQQASGQTPAADTKSGEASSQQRQSADAQMRMDGMGAGQQSPNTARTEAPSAPRQTQQSQTMNQAVVQVAKEAADGKRDVQIKLNPPHLGQMRVELQISDNKVNAIFHMDNRGAANLLDGQMQHLRTALQNQQLELEDAQVQVGGDGASGQQPRDGEGESESGGGRSGGRMADSDGQGSGGGEEDGQSARIGTPGNLSLLA